MVIKSSLLDRLLASLPDLSEEDKAKLLSESQREVIINNCLTFLMQDGKLKPEERAGVGDLLAILGDDPRPGVGLDADGLPDIVWVDIEGGEFFMGEGKERHLVTIPRFHIARYPITNAQYAAFMAAGGYEDKRWWTTAGWVWRQYREVPNLSAIDDKDFKKYYTDWYDQLENPIDIDKWVRCPWNNSNHPVNNVTWFEALAFCRWLAAQRNLDIRLPTEAQWECAAAGVEGRKYPWGNAKWDEQRANVEESGLCLPTPVGIYPAGATPEGVHDMAGNVSEWCLSLYESHPYRDDDGRNDEEASGLRILRGSAYISKRDALCCAFRSIKIQCHPGNECNHIGFRVIAFPSDF